MKKIAGLAAALLTAEPAFALSPGANVVPVIDTESCPSKALETKALETEVWRRVKASPDAVDQGVVEIMNKNSCDVEPGPEIPPGGVDYVYVRNAGNGFFVLQTSSKPGDEPSFSHLSYAVAADWSAPTR